MVDAINETHKFQFTLDNSSLMNIETVCRSKNRSQVLKGCLCAIDGMHLPMKNHGNVTHNPNRFYAQRNEKCALLHLACCDSNRKFTFFIVRNVRKAMIL